MMYRLATMPGDASRPNEDFAGVLGNCAILLDGAGAPGDLPTGCVHGVPWFVRQLGSRCLADMARMGEQLDYLVLGDSALIIETASGVQVVTDQRMEEVAPPEYRAMLALPTGTPEHQAARIAFVKRQQPLRNTPDGYPVASTDPDVAYKALTGSIPATQVHRAAMATDGVTRYAEFGLGSWDDMLGVLAAYGPGGLFARIREAEDSDPEGRRWPRAKKHDDAGLVFWESLGGDLAGDSGRRGA